MKMWSPVYSSFLQFSLNPNKELDAGVKQSDWDDFYQFCQKQAILGIVFEGIKRCEREQLDIPLTLLYEWISVSEQIRLRNQLLNKECAETAKILSDAGYRCCVLKGQGNALMYPSPWSRTPGDIDIWVDGAPEEVVEWVRKDYPKAEYNYVHVEFPRCKNVPTEIHYRCTYLFNRKSNKVLQSWIEDHREAQFTHNVKLPEYKGTIIGTPTNSFNHIFQLTHMLRHFLGTGVGLRHLIDYYYLLRQGVRDQDRQDFFLLTKKLGLYRFASAIMYVEKEVLGLDETYLIVPAEEKSGRILLRHIMDDGNFGHQASNGYLFSKHVLIRNAARLHRLLSIAYVCPKETVSKLIYGKPHF